MTDISQVTCCVVDHGLFPHIAQCMAEQCNHVYYAGPPEEVMEKIKDGCICERQPFVFVPVTGNQGLCAHRFITAIGFFNLTIRTRPNDLWKVLD